MVRSSKSGIKPPRCQGTISGIHVSIQYTLIEHLYSPGPGGIWISQLFPFLSPHPPVWVSPHLSLGETTEATCTVCPSCLGECLHPSEPWPLSRLLFWADPVSSVISSHSTQDMVSSGVSGHFFTGAPRLKFPSHQGPIWLPTFLATWPLHRASNFSSQGEVLRLSQGAGIQRPTAEVLLGAQEAPFLGGLSDTD